MLVRNVVGLWKIGAPVQVLLVKGVIAVGMLSAFVISAGRYVPSKGPSK